MMVVSELGMDGLYDGDDDSSLRETELTPDGHVCVQEGRYRYLYLQRNKGMVLKDHHGPRELGWELGMVLSLVSGWEWHCCGVIVSWRRRVVVLSWQ